jgi:hypothetical protein
MIRAFVQGLLSAFPKLLSMEKGKQHTFVETENVRCDRVPACATMSSQPRLVLSRLRSYVYHPLDGLFVVLVTNKGSNIMEDLDTLSTLVKCALRRAGA